MPVKILSKDWKFVGRLLAFIPAGFLAGCAVRVVTHLLQKFTAWSSPTSEFGNSFIEGGLMYLAFGTENGRLYTFLTWKFISEIVAAMVTIIVTIKIFPNASKRISKNVMFAMLLFYLVPMAISFRFFESTVGSYTTTIELLGGVCGVLWFWILWHYETRFDE